MNKDDYVGKTINEWHIDSYAYSKKWDYYFNCTCSCETKRVVNLRNILCGKSKSCGCKKKETTHKRCFLDRTGDKYYHLTCIRWEYRNKDVYWLCKCDCGNETWVKGSNLTSGAVKSCGCARNHVNRIHGMSHTRLHQIWSKMNDRCYNPHNSKYDFYGGRGIAICKEWQGTEGFINFMNWSLSHGYSDELTIDRIDNDRNYEPSNCRWATWKVQQRNTRRNKLYELNGGKYTCAELSETYGINYPTLQQRLNKLHWRVEEAVEIEPHKRKKVDDE